MIWFLLIGAITLSIVMFVGGAFLLLALGLAGVMVDEPDPVEWGRGVVREGLGRSPYRRSLSGPPRPALTTAQRRQLTQAPRHALGRGQR